MSARKLIITSRARADLEDILDQSDQRWGTHQADLYEDRLRRALADLLQFPHLGRKRDQLATGLRSFPADEHIIYYRLTGEALVVRRILHTRREVDRGMVI